MLTFRARLQRTVFGWTALISSIAAVASWAFTYEIVVSGLDHTLRARAEMLGAMCSWDAANDEIRFDWPAGLNFESLMARSPCELEIWRAEPWQLLHRSGPELPRHGTTDLLMSAPFQRASRARFHTLTSGDHPSRRLVTLRMHVPGARLAESGELGSRGDVLIRLAVVMQEEVRTLSRATWMYAGLAVTTALLLAGVAQAIADRFGRPLLALANAAKDAKPEALVSMPRSGKYDEIDRLATALEQSFAVHGEALRRQSEFTSNAAHELRSPLAAMRTSAEVALRRQRRIEDYEVFFRDVIAALDRSEATVSALLELSRLDRSTKLVLDPEPVELRDVAERAIAELPPAQRSRIALRAEEGPLVVPGRLRLLVILIGNLVRNALQYSPSGSPVEVDLSRGAERLEIAIRDHGPGLEPAELERVFERFYRSPSASADLPGSGLGLSIARGIAELHDGSLRLEVAQPGLRAIVSLPIAAS
ncbi:MAG: hypothetical protein JNM84_04515 [Planctomycetes bacterium]|nr:hypothetical protein [Planctomycetota bacterium]